MSCLMMVDVALYRGAQIVARCLATVMSSLGGEVTVQNGMLVGMHGKSILASEPVPNKIDFLCYPHLESG